MQSFLHEVTAENQSGSFTALDHPLLNDNVNARIMVTQAWNPVLGLGDANDHPVSPRYDVDFSGFGTWSIYNQDFAEMEIGLIFHVLILGQDAAAFLHLTSTTNTSGLASQIACPYPFASVCFSGANVLLHSHTLDAVGIRGGTFEFMSSLFFSSPSLILRLEFDSLSSMPLGALFWVLVASDEFAGEQSFVHVSTAGNTLGSTTLISHPLLDGNPNALPMVSLRQAASPADLLNEQIGMFYSAFGFWGINHHSGALIPEGTAFSIFVPPIFADGFESGSTAWW